MNGRISQIGAVGLIAVVSALSPHMASADGVIPADVAKVLDESALPWVKTVAAGDPALASLAEVTAIGVVKQVDGWSEAALSGAVETRPLTGTGTWRAVLLRDQAPVGTVFVYRVAATNEVKLGGFDAEVQMARAIMSSPAAALVEDEATRTAFLVEGGVAKPLNPVAASMVAQHGKSVAAQARAAQAAHQRVAGLTLKVAGGPALPAAPVAERSTGGWQDRLPIAAVGLGGVAVLAALAVAAYLRARRPALIS